MVIVAYNPKQVSTDDLKRGLMDGFNVTFYEVMAARELLARGERKAVMDIYDNTKRRMSKAGIRRALNGVS